MKHILHNKVMLMAVALSLAISGSVYAMKNDTAKTAAGIAQAVSGRELLLTIMSSAAEKKGVDLTRKVKGIVVLDNEIVVDAAESAFAEAAANQFAPLNGVQGLVLGWLKGVIIANGAKLVPDAVIHTAKNNLSKKAYYGLVVLVKGASRFAVDSVLKSIKASLESQTKGGGLQAARVSFGFEFRSGL